MSKKQKKQLQKDAGVCQGILSTLNSFSSAPEKDIPQELLLNHNTPGVFFGSLDNSWKSQYVGMKQGSDGHILVVGGSGTGKSSGIAKQTLRTWKGAIFALDVKGELSDHYRWLHDQGLVERPYIIFDFTDVEGPSYDPFWWLLADDQENLFINIKDIVLSIIQDDPNAKEPFWIESEQNLLEAALLHYCQLGLSFSESMCRITDDNVDILCQELARSTNTLVKRILGELGEMKTENSQMLYGIARGFRNKVLPFVTDTYISHAFRGKREGANCITWEDLEEFNIFVRVSEDMIAQRSAATNLMLRQMIRYFERRPDKHSPKGKNTVQTLLLLDELPRFGKLEMLSDAVSTLRSKRVNLCFMVQSMAQLDKIYGEYDRHIIFDNCRYKVILGASDVETQRYFSDLIETHRCNQYSISCTVDQGMKCTGEYNIHVSETYDRIIQPHELATLRDVLVISPYGFCRVNKCLSHNLDYARFPLCNSNNTAAAMLVYVFKRNGGAKMLTAEERAKNAQKCIKELDHKNRLEERQARKDQEKIDQRRNYIIGELVTSHFPEVLSIEPGTKADNVERFRMVDAFLAELAADQALFCQIKERANNRISTSVTQP